MCLIGHICMSSFLALLIKFYKSFRTVSWHGYVLWLQFFSSYHSGEYLASAEKMLKYILQVGIFRLQRSKERRMVPARQYAPRNDSVTERGCGHHRRGRRPRRPALSDHVPCRRAADSRPYRKPAPRIVGEGLAPPAIFDAAPCRRAGQALPLRCHPSILIRMTRAPLVPGENTGAQDMGAKTAAEKPFKNL